MPSTDDTAELEALRAEVAQLRRRVEAERRRARRMSEAMFEAIAVHEDGIILETNQRMADMLGYTPEEMVGLDATDLCIPADRELMRTRIREGDERPYRATGVRKDGTTFPAEVRGRALEYEGRKLRVTATRDLSREAEAADALRRSEERYRVVVEHASDGIVIAEQDGRVSEVNPRAAEMLGRPRTSLVGSPARALVEADDALALEEDLSSDRGALFERQVERPDGSVADLEIGVRRIPDGRLLLLMRDTTARKRAEQERADLRDRLAQSQKMESVGRLAGGIAHDFNNLLTVILGGTDALLSLLHPEGVAARHVREIEEASERAAELTRRLLAVGRRGVARVRSVDLGDLVRGAQSLLERVLGNDVRLQLRLDPHPVPIRADPGQLEQLLLSLAVNAREAMPEGGHLTIETGHTATATSEAGDRPRTEAVLTIGDEGHGMDEETRSRIFEPFFSTRPHGTGLGLSMVYGIVQQLGGSIDVESAPGAGARFQIRLPCTDDATPPATEPEPPAVEAPGRHSILLVEDDAMVRHAVRRMLESVGHRVVTAADPDEAAAAAAADPSLEVLLTDLVLGERSGRKLAERLVADHPRLAVLFMSGYTDDEIVREGVSRAELAFLPKPFTRATLLERIERLVGG